MQTISCQSPEYSIDKRQRLFNNDWKFLRDSIAGAEQVAYHDADWLSVDLPHDYSIIDLPGEDGPDQIGPFSKLSPGNGNSTGQVMGGTGWYRKSFTLDKADEGKTAIVKFDGVYMEAEVWVNGKRAGIHKNGYTPFWFNITPLLNQAGESNVIAVKVDNEGRNSRWYSGSGIYRNVHLLFTHPVHVGVWGAKITTPEISADQAMVEAEVSVQNDDNSEVTAEIIINIKDKEGKLVSTVSDNMTLSGKDSKIIRKQIEVKSPLLWSLESPNLYHAEVMIKTNNEVTDIYHQTFGIRSIAFSAEKGFLLNGEAVLLKGACVHHDHGLLGAAAFERAEERKVEILKASGFNAIRCSHNPFSEDFYDACDRQGMLVIDEFTDMWEYYKNPQDYSVFFNEWWNKDLTDWMMRNRNHPSIIMWSIGNEINGKVEDNRLDIAKALVGRVKELDDTRPVTQAITGFFYPAGWESTAPAFELVDVGGYNYNWEQFEDDHQKYPERIMYSSESFTKQAYDNWKAVKKNPYVIGDFIWTAWDYIGEVSIGKPTYVPAEQETATIGNFSDYKIPEGVNIFDLQVHRPSEWPYYLANVGDIDITGEKSPQMLYRDVLWGKSDLEINVHEPVPEGLKEFSTEWAWPMEWPHWNWQGNEGKPLQVRVFTRASRVKLELNGETIDEKELTDEDKYMATFEVPYQSGELKATAFENDKEVASKTLKTSAEPAAIRLIADRNQINADRNELAFVKVEVIDASGQLVPQDSIEVKLQVTGEGELVASGNASPKGMESFNKSVMKMYQGKAQAIIRPYTVAGDIKLTAEANGLRTAELSIKTKE